MMGRMDCCGESHVGLVRENNEDQFLIADLKKSVIIHHTSLSYEDETELLGGSQAKLMLVADGVGGNAAGERASSLALESVIQYLLNAMHWMFRPEDEREASFVDDLKSALSFTQERIQHAAESAPYDDGMGTTITMAYVVWPHIYLVHAGDSRAYLYRNGDLTLLTHDQTFAQELADAGVLQPEQIPASPLKHVLSSLVGCDPAQLNPRVYRAELALNDTLLLCTDGLTRHLNESGIAAILRSDESASTSCRKLIESANDAGGQDNTTVIVARFCDRTTTSATQESAHAGGKVDVTAQRSMV
ncbi:MAG: protein phosphatase 2C domain-containing protein [Planctomycetaceae bacterium]